MQRAWTSIAIVSNPEREFNHGETRFRVATTGAPPSRIKTSAKSRAVPNWLSDLSEHGRPSVLPPGQVLFLQGLHMLTNEDTELDAY